MLWFIPFPIHTLNEKLMCVGKNKHLVLFVKDIEIKHFIHKNQSL